MAWSFKGEFDRYACATDEYGKLQKKSVENRRAVPKISQGSFRDLKLLATYLNLFLAISNGIEKDRIIFLDTGNKESKTFSQDYIKDAIYNDKRLLATQVFVLKGIKDILEKLNDTGAISKDEYEQARAKWKQCYEKFYERYQSKKVEYQEQGKLKKLKLTVMEQNEIKEIKEYYNRNDKENAMLLYGGHNSRKRYNKENSSNYNAVKKNRSTLGKIIGIFSKNVTAHP